MIYTSNELDNLNQKFKNQKLFTNLISIGLLILMIICVILAFKVKSIVFIVLGFTINIILFAFYFYRLNVLHKNSKLEIEFYADIYYSEKFEEEVVFLKKLSPIISNKRKYNLIEVFRLKENTNYKFLIDVNHQITMEENKRYLLTLSNNIVCDYKSLAEVIS